MLRTGVQRAGMTRFMLILPVALIVTLMTIPPSLFAAESDDETGFEDYIRQMQAVYDTVSNYTCTFYKRERVNDTLLPRERIFMKFRKPFSIYMRWKGDAHAGQEALFVRGKYNDKMIAHKGSFPDITMRVDPTGRLAMRRNRHPITEAGIGATIEDIVNDYHRARANPEDSVTYEDLGYQEIYGHRCHCFRIRVPEQHESEYYGPLSEVCISKESKLPVRLRIWNSDGKLIEDYGYTDLDLNPGLTSKEFDPDNPSYDF